MGSRYFSKHKTMASQAQDKLLLLLPVIDLFPETIVSDKTDAESFSSGIEKDVRRALEEYGCFVAVWDKLVPTELEKNMVVELKRLFDLPKETKTNTESNPNPAYFGPSPKNPLFECFIFLDGKDQQIHNFAHRMWPAGNDTLCETAISFSKLLSQVNEIVMKMVFQSYGVGNYYKSLQVESTTTSYVLGFSKFGAPNKDETNTDEAVPHRDNGFLSISYQNQVKTFGIKTKNGEWIAHQPAPSRFLVIAGEAFQRWSNGRIHAPYHSHGVMMTGKEDGYLMYLDMHASDATKSLDKLLESQLSFQSDSSS